MVTATGALWPIPQDQKEFPTCTSTGHPSCPISTIACVNYHKWQKSEKLHVWYGRHCAPHKQETWALPSQQLLKETTLIKDILKGLSAFILMCLVNFLMLMDKVLERHCGIYICVTCMSLCLACDHSLPTLSFPTLSWLHFLLQLGPHFCHLSPYFLSQDSYNLRRRSLSSQAFENLKQTW